MTRRGLTRLGTIGLVPLAIVVVAYVLLRSTTSYTLNARFVDAGQLVKGDLVEVAGRRVGSVSAIRLTNDNQADIVLRITDGGVAPLHQGTLATVRAVGLSGIANRYVELTPGPGDLPRIPDGGTLPTTQTRPIVDLDALLNALDPGTRSQLRQLIREGAQIGAGTTAQTNAALLYLNPALSQTADLASQIVSDRAALDRLIGTTAGVAHTLAGRRTSVDAGVTSTASVLGALASRRRALADALVRAPGVLSHADRTLTAARSTLQVVRPTLRAAQPVAAPLAHVLALFVPTARDTIPALASLRRLFPGAVVALHTVPPLLATTLPALGSATTTLRQSLPILTGFRPYAPEVVTGLFDGFGGSTGGAYDANGHFVRIAAVGGLLGFTGAPATGPASNGPGPGYVTGQTARCPGGAIGPAADASNPFVADPALCDPGHDQP